MVLTATMTPGRVTLAGAWDLGELTITWWAVHETLLQARALNDQVTGAFYSDAARSVLAGTLDVVPGREAAEDRVGGVPQVRSGAVMTLTRT